LFVVLGSLEEMQSKAVVFFLFYFWSIIELFRSVRVFLKWVCAEQWGCFQEPLRKILIFLSFGRLAQRLASESKIPFRRRLSQPKARTIWKSKR